jgi:chloride channel 3/4/5
MSHLLTTFELIHSPIMAMMQILGGYVLDAFLSPWTLLIKALGLALAVASGLSLGKEVRSIILYSNTKRGLELTVK